MDFNLAAICDALARAYPDREAIVWRDRRLTWAQVDDRTKRFASTLGARGLGMRGSLADCAPWESPHDHVALYLLNSNEYLEAMLGSYVGRAAPVNINYRYVAEELAYVLRDAQARVVVYHGRFASTLAEALAEVPSVELLLRVDDGSGDELLPGAIDYEAALAAADPSAAASNWSPDDLYVLYTGGTTGYPKGVLWRQADFLVACTGLRRKDGSDFESIEELVERAARGAPIRSVPAPPFMHGAANWNTVATWCSGGTVVLQDHVDHFDPVDVLSVCEREQVSSLLIVGDAFARPLVDELHRHDYDLEPLRFLLTGGAILSASVKRHLLDAVPGLQIVDVLGSSESGRQGIQRSTSAAAPTTGDFERGDAAAVLSDKLDRVLAPGDDELGWLAQTGRVPRGYLGDETKTARTFPVVDGIRYAVPGDRARLRADGSIELHGRDSVTINSGGEKIFAEEVEHALKHHPDVYDVLVVGRPSERWGQEVVAVIEPRAGVDPLDADLTATAAEHLARFKLPKAYIRVDRVQRSPSGKPDYGWARSVVTAGEEPAE